MIFLLLPSSNPVQAGRCCSNVVAREISPLPAPGIPCEQMALLDPALLGGPAPNNEEEVLHEARGARVDPSVSGRALP